MVRNFCDRCNKEVYRTKMNTPLWHRLPKLVVSPQATSGDWSEKIACPECWKDLQDVVKGYMDYGRLSCNGEG